MLAEFDKLVQERAELQRWWKLGSTQCGYGGGCHTLRVDVHKPCLVTYCGQQRAGAQNYHYAPKWFAECVRTEMQGMATEIATAAYEKAIARLNEQIESHRDAVMAELAK